jgi:hypothetical protein
VVLIQPVQLDTSTCHPVVLSYGHTLFVLFTYDFDVCDHKLTSSLFTSWPSTCMVNCTCEEQREFFDKLFQGISVINQLNVQILVL